MRAYQSVSENTKGKYTISPAYELSATNAVVTELHETWPRATPLRKLQFLCPLPDLMVYSGHSCAEHCPPYPMDVCAKRRG
jgi:hypothetical protein